MNISVMSRQSLARRFSGVLTIDKLALFIPSLLAVCAFWPLLFAGFVSDDFVFLLRAQNGWTAIYPGPQFFRPLGEFLTWKLPELLAISSPIYYHAVSLLLHATNALLLTLWLRQVVGARAPAATPVLAGVLFAVFPLATEPVGWISAQWDLWACCFGLSALLLFNSWRQRVNSGLITYFGAWTLYGAALLCKESWLCMSLLFPLSAALIERPTTRSGYIRLLLSAAPFIGLSLASLLMRYFAWGTLGGYGFSLSPIGVALIIIIDLGVLLAPLNSAIFPTLLLYVTFAISLFLILQGIIATRLKPGALWLLVGAWLTLALAPIYQLYVNIGGLENSRLLYLPLAGYCLLLAHCLGALWRKAQSANHTLTPYAAALAATALILVCWSHSAIWQVGGRQAQDIGSQLRSYVSAGVLPARNATNVVWQTENQPYYYKHTFVLLNGLADMAYLEGAAYPSGRTTPLGELTDHTAIDKQTHSACFTVSFIPALRHDAAGEFEGYTLSVAAQCAAQQDQQPASQ